MPARPAMIRCFFWPPPPPGSDGHSRTTRHRPVRVSWEGLDAEPRRTFSRSRARGWCDPAGFEFSSGPRRDRRKGRADDREARPLQCPECPLGGIPRSVDGRLAGCQIDAVRARAAECADCRAELDTRSRGPSETDLELPDPTASSKGSRLASRRRWLRPTRR